jgi:hypothetical protein
VQREKFTRALELWRLVHSAARAVLLTQGGEQRVIYWNSRAVIGCAKPVEELAQVGLAAHGPLHPLAAATHKARVTAPMVAPTIIREHHRYDVHGHVILPFDLAFEWDPFYVHN